MALAALLGFAEPARAAESDAATLTIGGTGAALGTMVLLQQHLERTQPRVHLRILPSLGSTGAIAAVLAGAIDIAISSRLPNGREGAAGALARPYARTPFAFVAHPLAQVSAITLAEVTRIYAGSLLAWPNGSRIRLIRRPFNDTDTMTLQAISPAMEQAVEAALRRPDISTAGNDQDNGEALEATPGSFGGMTLAQWQVERRRVTPLALDGVEPSLGMLAAGRYPLAKTFYTVTAAAPSPAAVAFQAFLVGAEGQILLAGLGQAPIPGSGIQ